MSTEDRSENHEAGAQREGLRIPIWNGALTVEDWLDSEKVVATCREQQEKGGTVRTRLSRSKTSDRGNILTFDKGFSRTLQTQRPTKSQLIDAERMAEIGMMACSISHDMRHALSAIYANAEFLERRDRCANARTHLVLEIQEAVLAMTERIDSLLQFGRGNRNPHVPECISFVVEQAVAAVKSHPDGRNISISVGRFTPAKAVIDARNLESAIYNLLLNACQAAARSTRVPEVNVQVAEADEEVNVTISDNGPGIPAAVRTTLFNPFVTAGKPNGTGLGLTLARRIAEEHGGSLCLAKSNRGMTIFTLSVKKNRSLTLEDLKGGGSAFEIWANGSASCS